MSEIYLSDELLKIPRGGIGGGEGGGGGPVYALDFPKNNGATSGTPMTAIKFANPQSNGLPIWGPSNAGVTVVRKIKPYQQNAADGGTKYNAMFWWSPIDWQFGENYWGFHTYPLTDTSDTHHWEIGVEGADQVNNRNGSPVQPTYDSWYFQGIRITRNGDASKTLVFYFNLPSTTNDNVIEYITQTTYAESNPAGQITIGDSPWYGDYQHEAFAGAQGPIKIFDKVLSEADMISEAGDFTQLVTSEGAAHIWWGKKSFATADALSCDYGTGRSFVWDNASYKAGIIQIT